MNINHKFKWRIVVDSGGWDSGGQLDSAVFVCDLEGAIEFGFDWRSLRIFMLMLLCYFTCRNNFSISTDLFFPVITSFDL